MGIPKKPCFRFALIFSILIGCALGQPGWIPMDGPSPGNVQSIVSIDNVLLATGSTYRYFRASTAEGPWSTHMLPDNGIPVFIQAVDSLVFAFDGTTLFRSADRGLTWRSTVRQTSFAGAPRRIFRSNGSLAMATAEGRYMSSYDQGLTWRSYQQSPSGNAYGLLMIEDSLVFAGTDAGLYVSSNQGGSWKRLRGGLPDGQVLALERMLGKLFVSITGQGLFASSDNGRNWIKMDGGLAKAGVKSILDIGASPSGKLMLLSDGGSAGVLGSRDSGKTWASLNQGLPFTREGTGIFYSTYKLVFQGDSVLVSTSSGVYRSTNGGLQWSSANQGLPGSGEAYLGFCEAGADLYASVFANEGAPAYRSGDGGRTWKRADTLLDGMRLMRTEGNDWFAMTDWRMVRSIDGGKTWTALRGLRISGEGPIAFDLNGNDLAVAHNSEASTLFFSSDKGTTWNAETDSRPAARLGDLRFQAVAKRLRLSSNGGRTWTDLPMQFPEDVNALQSGGGLLSLLSGSMLYLSADSGLTWKRPGGLAENLPVTSLSQSGSRIYAATRKGLLLSKDGGTVWKALQQGLPIVAIKALAANEGRLFAADSLGLHLREKSAPGWKTLTAAPTAIRHLAVWKDIILAATEDYRLWISLDAGTTWKPTADSVQDEIFISLAIDSNKAFASKLSGLYCTTDSGRTWEPVPSPNLTRPPVTMAIGDGRLHASTGIDSYFSQDGGLHWSFLPMYVIWRQRHLAGEGGVLYGSDDYGVRYAVDNGAKWTDCPPIQYVTGLAYSEGRVYAADGKGTGLKYLDQVPTGLRSRASGTSAADGIRLETQGGTAVFRFDLQGNGWVTWEIYSADGRRAGSFESQSLPPGSYAIPYGLPESREGLLYRAEIRPVDRLQAPTVRVGRLAP